MDPENHHPRAQFEALQKRLGANGDAPGVGYEYLRRRLIIFFDVRAPAESDALADITLDRMARRLSDGVQIDDVRLYALGVARFVLKERAARAMREELAMNDPTFTPPAIEVDDDDADALPALLACLGELGEKNASLIRDYYQGESGERIKNRDALATKLGVAINALRNRALRLREVLERCVTRRLNRDHDTPRDGSRKSDTTKR